MKSFVCVLIPNSCPWEGSLWLRQVCWPHSKLCVDVQWPAPLDPSLGSTTYWLGEGGQVVWLWADWACLWVPFSSILNPGKPHGTPSSVAGQTEEATFASSPGPEAPHRWAAPSSDVLHLSLSIHWECSSKWKTPYNALWLVFKSPIWSLSRSQMFALPDFRK